MAGDKKHQTTSRQLPGAPRPAADANRGGSVGHLSLAERIRLRAERDERRNAQDPGREENDLGTPEMRAAQDGKKK